MNCCFVKKIPLLALAMIPSMTARATSQGTLVKEAKMDLIAGGHVIGFAKIPSGTRVMIVTTNSMGEFVVQRTQTETPFAVPCESVALDSPPQPTTPPAPSATSSPVTQPASSGTPAPSTTSPPELYDVTIETTFVVPTNNYKISDVVILRGLPPKRDWSDNTGEYGATDLKFTPGSAKLVHDDKNNWNFLVWENKGMQKPGTKLVFTSTYTVKSQQRQYNPAVEKVSWDDYKGYLADKDAEAEMRRIKGRKEINPEVAKIADEFRNLPPSQAIDAVCDWISKNFTGDGTVTYTPIDIKNIMEHKKGHCGHRFYLMKEFTDSLGIPMRMVHGFLLNDPDGTGKFSSIRSDYTNVHGWGEIYFPTVGWVEVEPARRGAEMYTMPSCYIQNDIHADNYRIFFKEAGVVKRPEWIPNGHGFDSNCGLENKITFVKRSGA